MAILTVLRPIWLFYGHFDGFTANLAVFGQYWQYWPVLGCIGQYWPYCTGTGPTVPVLAIPIPHTGTHTPYPWPPPYHIPGYPTHHCPLLHAHGHAVTHRSQRPEAGHQASFLLNTKGHVYILMAIFGMTAKSDTFRLCYNPTLLKWLFLTVFMTKCSKMAVFGHIWPIIEKMGYWVWGVGLFGHRK